MKKIFFTPGPSELYPTIPSHIKKSLKDFIPSISHRSDSFHAIYESAIAEFKKLYKIPKDHYVFFLSSATEAMERILENLVIDKSLHFVNGSFSSLFHKTAASLGLDAQKIEVPMGEGFQFDNLKTPKKFEIACFTQNETSTGVIVPMKDIYIFKKDFPKTLVALDIVSAAPYVDVDFSRLDCVFFSVQKGFGLPAGLGVLVLKPEVIEIAQRIKKNKISQGSYHSFASLKKYYEKKETPETPNVLGIYLFGKVCSDMNKVGIKIIRQQTQEKAKNLYELTENNKVFSPFVKEKNHRSMTVIVLNVKGGSEDIQKKLKQKNMIAGSGYRDLKYQQIRIANFPAHSPKDMNSLVKFLKSYTN